jgi:hypothetical protein
MEMSRVPNFDKKRAHRRTHGRTYVIPFRSSIIDREPAILELDDKMHPTLAVLSRSAWKGAATLLLSLTLWIDLRDSTP